MNNVIIHYISIKRKKTFFENHCYLFLIYHNSSFITFHFKRNAICLCRSKYCKIADKQNFLRQHYLQFFVVNCYSSRVPRSIWTFSLAGLWPTKTYSTSLERCNIYTDRYTKSSRVCWGVEVLYCSLKYF